jgi:hypothetical protein
MVKAKGNINTPMAQLVEVALEEESAIKSERFRKNFSKKGSLDTRELEMRRGDRTSLERSE